MDEERRAPALLDVREPYELTGVVGHLRGIVNIPVGDLSRRLAELEAYREQEIVTIAARADPRIPPLKSLFKRASGMFRYEAAE